MATVVPWLFCGLDHGIFPFPRIFAIKPETISNNSRLSFGVMAGASVVLAQLATYAFTPAFPQITVSLNCRPDQVQLTISAYLLGFAVSQLFYGPLSEIMGRRKGLLWAMGIFTAGNLACSAAGSLSLLMLSLFLTSLGAGGLPSIGRSILRDVYGPIEISRVMSRLVTFLSMAPIVSPLLGGQVAAWLGWREIFLLCAVAGAAMLLLAGLFLPETGPPPVERYSLKKISHAYLGFMRDRDFMGYVFLTGFAMAGFTLYFSGAPFYYQSRLGMGPGEYGWWFLICCLGYPAGSLWSHRLLGRTSLRGLGLVGVGLMALGSAAGALLSYLAGPSLAFMVPCVLVFTMGLGICITVGRGGALAVIHADIGLGSGLMGFLLVITGSLVNAMGSRFDLVKHEKVSLAMLACSCLACLALCLVREPKGPGRT